MEQERYEPPVIVELGSVQELTLANNVGPLTDRIVPQGTPNPLPPGFLSI